VVKQTDERRNCYQIQAHLPLPDPTSRECAVGEVLISSAIRRLVASPDLAVPMWRE
jgi:hypothetical protein